MELNNNSNDDDTHAKLDEPSRAMPFEIDLNEPPLSSPRDSLPAAELSPPPSRHRVALLDINAAPPSEAEPDHCVESVNSGYGNILPSSSFEFLFVFSWF
jgi:hypothetical protein